MKRFAVCRTIAVITLAISSVTFAQTKSAAVLLRDGMNRETIQKDLPGAILLYRQAVEAAGSSNPEVAATALFRLGAAYKTVGDEKARATLQEVINKFGDQTIAREARSLLDSMTADVSSKEPRISRLLTGDDADPAAYVTFDGRYMVRTDWDSGDLIVREMATGKVIPLGLKTGLSNESDAYASNPILSPDGKQVVYMWYPDDKSSADNYQLRTKPVDRSSTPTTLIDNPKRCCFQPFGWAPDGRIFFTVSAPDGTWEIAWLSLADPAVRRLQDMGRRLRDRPRLSPDGKYVAYAAVDASPTSSTARSQSPSATVSPDQFIYVLPTNGSGAEEAVARGGSVNESPIWTRDGKHILFVSNRSTNFGLYSIEVKSGAAISNPSSVQMNIADRISPIGMTGSDELYYLPQKTPGGFDVFTAGFKAGKIRGRRTPLAEIVADWNRAPAWSPDGNRIAFKRRRPNQTNALFDLVVYDLRKKNEEVYSYSGLDNSVPVWFHNSKSVLLRRNYNGRTLVRLDVETGDLVRIQEWVHAALPANIGQAALSPDDKTLYMTVEGVLEGNSEDRVASLVAMNLETGEQSEVWRSAEGSPSLTGIAVSPDGKALAMTLRRDRWTTPRLFRLDIQTKSFKELADSVAEAMFTWTPDSRSLVFAQVSNNEGRIMRIAADGSGKAAFTGLVLSEACACGHTIDFNPEGSTIVFSDGTRENNVLYRLENVSMALRRSR